MFREGIWIGKPYVWTYYHSASHHQSIKSGQSTGVMLPPLNVDQPFVYVSALERGNVCTPCNVVVDGNSQGEFISCPSLPFSLWHSKTKSWVVFDLGIRRDLEGYTPLCQELIKAVGLTPVVNPDSRRVTGQGRRLPWWGWNCHH